MKADNEKIREEHVRGRPKVEKQRDTYRKFYRWCESCTCSSEIVFEESLLVCMLRWLNVELFSALPHKRTPHYYLLILVLQMSNRTVLHFLR